MGQVVRGLEPVFELFNTLIYKNSIMTNYKFYVMGQICVAEAYRGQGVFDKMYQKHKDVFSNTYELCVTEVSVRNMRSMKAHERVGFKKIHTYTDPQETWNIMVWDWASAQADNKIY
jgi:hypothetical protein